MQRTRVGLAGLIIIIAVTLTACGGGSGNVKQAASSLAASKGTTFTRGAAVTPAQSEPAQSTPARSTPAQSEPAQSTPAQSSSAPATTTTASSPQTHSQSAEAAPSPSAAAGGSPPAGASTSPTASTGSGSPWLWVWIGLGAAAVAGLIAWAIAAHRRRTSTATDWQARRIDAYAKGSVLHDAMAAADTPGGRAAADAAVRWSDIQRRADDFGQVLYAMGQSAPTDQERLVIADVLAALQAARSAMDAERSAGSADGSLSNIAADRLAYFASTLNLLRQSDAKPA